jgi:hypothetical protein
LQVEVAFPRQQQEISRDEFRQGRSVPWTPTNSDIFEAQFRDLMSYLLLASVK